MLQRSRNESLGIVEVRLSHVLRHTRFRTTDHAFTIRFIGHICRTLKFLLLDSLQGCLGTLHLDTTASQGNLTISVSKSSLPFLLLGLVFVMLVKLTLIMLQHAVVLLQISVHAALQVHLTLQLPSFLLSSHIDRTTAKWFLFQFCVRIVASA